MHGSDFFAIAVDDVDATLSIEDVYRKHMISGFWNLQHFLDLEIIKDTVSFPMFGTTERTGRNLPKFGTCLLTPLIL